MTAAESSLTHEEAHRRLAALYAELDRSLAALEERVDTRCRACGKCCDFSAHEHRLFASRLEREYLGMDEAEAQSDACPFLGADGRCARYERRTLACRTFRCRPSGREAEARAAFYEEFRARLAALSDAAGMEWDYRQVLPRPE